MSLETSMPDLIAQHCACCRRPHDPAALDAGRIDRSTAGMCYVCASTPEDQRPLRALTDTRVIGLYRTSVRLALQGIVNGVHLISARNMLAELIRRHIDPLGDLGPPG